MTLNHKLGVTQYHLSQNFKQSFIFLASGSFQHTVASLFLYLRLCSFALHLVYCAGRYVNEMFFILHIVSKSPAEISTAICAV